MHFFYKIMTFHFSYQLFCTFWHPFLKWPIESSKTVYQTWNKEVWGVSASLRSFFSYVCSCYFTGLLKAWSIMSEATSVGKHTLFSDNNMASYCSVWFHLFSFLQITISAKMVCLYFILSSPNGLIFSCFPLSTCWLSLSGEYFLL